MVTLSRVFFVVCLMAALTACNPAEPPEPPVDFTVNTDDGQLSLSQFRGEVVYVDFWATWCGPCRDSFPWMADMQNKYRDQGLKIIALSLDTDHDMARDFAEELSANFTIGFDDSGEVADLFKVKGMPTSVVIDRDGRIAEIHEGFKEEEQDRYEASIEKPLRKKRRNQRSFSDDVYTEYYYLRH